ncbi:DUF6705 family protein [Elizabethkingia anophelis]|uniref:DUF6705 family protein n=1 Tax=Elizabethkingia anophelis TaxID=1117645 RepID=UPI00293C7DF6|nr:hypothetical protein [Elizabethkingia anophelis]
MKNKLFIIIFSVAFTFFCEAQQIYSLRPSSSTIPENSYQKDTNNELGSYEGTWAGNWNNKTIYITFRKLTYKYDNLFKYYRDYLVGKFKVVDNNGKILFDNTNVSDEDAKIEGLNFRKYNDRYTLVYIDPSVCLEGSIYIKLMDSSNTKLEFKFSQTPSVIDKNCPYYNAPEMPEPLPSNIILTKQ